MMRCPNCNMLAGAPEWKARTHIKWSNKHGNCKRLFCDVCGQWSDITTKYGSSVELTTQTVVVIHPPYKSEAING